MDINEVSGKKINRHPWELSRTISLFNEWKPYFDMIGERSRYIDIGAGDMFFDKFLMHYYREYELHAVDIGYDTSKINYIKTKSKNVNLYSSIEDLDVKDADFALMLDSIEYMPNESSYISDLAKKIKAGGYIFFAMPAYQFLFSQHDINVKLLRRYSYKEFKRIIDDVDDIEIVDAHYFYFSLFLIRLIQKFLIRNIDPDIKVTTGWRWKRKNIITRVTVGTMNLDYAIGKRFSNVGINIPGLSLMAICKKKD